MRSLILRVCCPSVAFGAVSAAGPAAACEQGCCGGPGQRLADHLPGASPQHQLERAAARVQVPAARGFPQRGRLQPVHPASNVHHEPRRTAAAAKAQCAHRQQGKDTPEAVTAPALHFSHSCGIVAQQLDWALLSQCAWLLAVVFPHLTTAQMEGCVLACVLLLILAKHHQAAWRGGCRTSTLNCMCGSRQANTCRTCAA